MAEKHFYITTTLPYVNSDPHVGFAMEIIRADAVARFHAQMGEKVFFNTGTDEHGLKIYQKAIENNLTPQQYVDGYAEKFKELKSLLNLSVTNFIRTTDEQHIKAAQEFWKRCDANGDIYKKVYKAKYCVGCELEKTDSELVNGRCPIHPDREIEIIEEENYFFRFSKYADKLLALYKNDPAFVLPDFRLNEITKFIERGLEDFSISRLKEKMPWGIEVPGDENHVMYVWFDALVNYIAAVGWPDDEAQFKTWWPGVQYAGKDNLRQQSAMWQAMLMSAGLPTSKKIIINGFITSGGQKMSKSLGNVVNPVDVVGEYGTDALRYFLLREIPLFEDGDFTMERFKETYNANLANGIGNLTNRILKMALSYEVEYTISMEKIVNAPEYIAWKEALEGFDVSSASHIIWKKIGEMDAHIQATEPFKLVKVDSEKAKSIVAGLVEDLALVAELLKPLLPDTAIAIQSCIEKKAMPEQPLFLRKD